LNSSSSGTLYQYTMYHLLGSFFSLGGLYWTKDCGTVVVLLADKKRKALIFNAFFSLVAKGGLCLALLVTGACNEYQIVSLCK
jgi:hypothetical protein